MKILFLRPYYGGNVNGDVSGGFGYYDYNNHVFADTNLVYAASLVERLGVELKVIDANAEKILPDKVVNLIDKSFDTILLKIQIPTAKLDVEFARCLKRIFPNSRIILIGSTAITLREWVRRNVPGIEVAEIKNIEDYVYYLITSNKKNVTLDELPTPNYNLLPYRSYYDSSNEMRASLYTSRGCKINCSYCPYTYYYEGIYEERSIRNLANDIESLMRLGFQKITFRDQNFGSNKKRVLDICNMIKEKNYKIRWEAETRIDSLDKDILDSMIDAGVSMVSFGVESSSENTLKAFNRPNTKMSKYKELVTYLNSKNINTLSFYIFGFPQDKWDDIMLTFNLALELETTYANFNVWNPYVGTSSWEEYKQYNENSPDLYNLFERRMNAFIPNRMEVDRLDFAARYLNYKYIEIKKGIEAAYKDYEYQENEKKRQTDGIEISNTFFSECLKNYY